MPFPLVFVLALLVQGTPATRPTDGLALLQDVAQQYSQAKSYHVEVVRELTTSNELARSWGKTLLTAIVAPGGRYRYEGRSGYSWAVLVSDGTTRWNYHVHEGLYVQTDALAPDPDTRRVITQEEFAAEEAKRVVSEIYALSKRLKSATLVDDEKLMLNGRTVECHVVGFSDNDLKVKDPNFKVEETVWIEKLHNVIVKRKSRKQTYSYIGGSRARIPITTEEITVYSVVQLDQEEPHSTFVFAAPPEAKLVASFPSRVAPRPSEPRRTDFVGKPAPELRLESSDGKVTTLSAFRGKPVFIDFWATWCAACIEQIPELMKLHAETAPNGVVWISIDNDENASDAATFFSEQRIPWPNYHDEDGSLGKLFAREGLPLGVLIDSEGMVSFYKSGYEASELRAALAKFGPGFSSSTPAKANSK
jgi:cytochrome c biogenesis protein CcmG/thiol:disulfide interchange protein DsbE